MTAAASSTTTTTAPQKPRHLLVCVDVHDKDGCDLAHGLVARAAVLAAGLGARMTVFTALPPLETPGAPPVGGEGATYRALVEKAVAHDESCRRVVRTLVERARDGGADVESRVIEGHARPADAIVHAVADLGADLVVVASHSRKGLRHAVLGSVAEQVARDATVPVVIVPRVALT